MKQVWLNLVSGALMAVAILGYSWWLVQVSERKVLEITAPRENADLALPIFAQFTVTQRLTLADPIELYRLAIPVYFPDPGTQLAVQMVQENQEIGQWQVSGEGMTMLDLRLITPRVVSGTVEVSMQASQLTHEEAEAAPRVFPEPDDTKYPGGNYRIANNEKKGDIALAFYQQRSRAAWLLKDWQGNPVRWTVWLGSQAAALMLLAVLPSVLGRKAQAKCSGDAD